MQEVTNIKVYMHELADQLPMNATLDDAIYRLVERREIDLGLADSAAGRTTAVEDVMKEFGIDP